MKAAKASPGLKRFGVKELTFNESWEFGSDDDD
jgi:hypothetical protein